MCYLTCILFIVRIFFFCLCSCLVFLGVNIAMAEEVSIVFNDAGYVPFFSAGEENSDGEYEGEGMFIDFLDAFENAHPEHTIRRIRLPRPRANMMISTGEVDGYALMSPVFMDTKGGTFLFLRENMVHHGCGFCQSKQCQMLF